MQGCPYCHSNQFIKDGRYFRKNDSRYVQRFQCKECFKKFSIATTELECGHKKRRINYQVFKLYCSGVSLNRMAWILGVHRLTIKRKILYLAKKCNRDHQKLIQNRVFSEIHIDDLITIEHTKLKPLSVTNIYASDQRLILKSQVSQIPAFGLLAKISRAKYGYRESHLREGLDKVFTEVAPYIKKDALFKSDMHQLYPEYIFKYFPKAELQTFKSEKGCVSGQGELKKQKYDPIFSINQFNAKLRADLNRLFRRTWCTTKDPRMLQCHLDIYRHFYNLRSLKVI